MTILVKNIFSDKEIIELYKMMSSYCGEGSSFSESGRYIVSSTLFLNNANFAPIIEKIEKIVEENFNKKMKVVTTGFHLYKKCFGEPRLTPHIDDYAGEVVFDYQLDATIDWPIRINKENYILKNNDAVMFEGELVPHSRPEINFNGLDYVLVFIANLVSESHWFNDGKINPKDQNIIMKEILKIREDKENW